MNTFAVYIEEEWQSQVNPVQTFMLNLRTKPLYDCRQRLTEALFTLIDQRQIILTNKLWEEKSVGKH